MLDSTMIVTRLHQHLAASGALPKDVGDAFIPARADELACLTDLYGTILKWSQVYREADLEPLKGVTVPPAVIDFYRRFEPNNLPVLSGGVRLLGLRALRDENTALSPGAYIIKFGVMVFATTIGGHAICMDLNQVTDDGPRIILVDHTFCSYNDDLQVVECVNMLPEDLVAEYAADEPIVLSYEVIARSAPEVSHSFGDFMLKLASDGFADIETEFLPET